MNTHLPPLRGELLPLGISVPCTRLLVLRGAEGGGLIFLKVNSSAPCWLMAPRALLRASGASCRPRLRGVRALPRHALPIYDWAMAESYPCPECGESVSTDEGRRSFSPWIGPGEGPAEKTVQRADCPYCGKPLIRAALQPESRWQPDRSP
jgi:predicted RNA-binding Zn-ribbon protein involved in translation (DUF1610 family)